MVKSSGSEAISAHAAMLVIYLYREGDSDRDSESERVREIDCGSVCVGGWVFACVGALRGCVFGYAGALCGLVFVCVC